MTDSHVPSVTLNDDRQIPQLGFGVFQVPPEQTQETVEQAFEVGYRHIDTAQMYGNEAGVGAAIKASGLPREDLWITTKLNNGFHRPDDARRTFGESLGRLGLDQVDLFLIHWPLPTRYDGDYASTWRTLTELHEDGRARSIGVSNFEPAHLQTIIDATGVVPAVNQIEVHPFLGNEAARAADAQHGIATEAWAPIAKGRVNDDADDQGDRRPARADSRPGHSALAPPARRHRLPQVDAPRADARELRDLRLRALRRRRRDDHRARPRRGRPYRPQPEHDGLARLTPGVRVVRPTSH